MRAIHINDKEGNKMKTMKILTIVLGFVISACSTSSTIHDDVYYARGGSSSNEKAAVAKAPVQTYTATAESSNADYNYESFYEESVSTPVYENTSPSYSKTETVTEPDGTSYTTTETYYDSEYSSRFRRFHSGSSSFNYYDGYNTGCFDCGMTSMYMGFGYPYGMGWSMGYGYGWPRYSYYDPFYSPWYGYYGWSGYYGYGFGSRWGYSSYWAGYNHGYWNGFYDGGGYGGWYSDAYRPGGSSRYYGHRGSYGGGTTIPNGSPRGNITKSAEAGSPRGTRTADTDIRQEAATSTRGAVAGTRPDQGNRQAAIARPDRTETQTRERIERPANTRIQAETRPSVQREETTRPAASERINQYRERYERPASAETRQQAREQRYERPKNYTAPNVRQPKSSNEYVRPQAVEQNRQTQRSQPSARPSAPTQRQPAASPSRSTTRSQPSTVRSQPTQRRQSSTPARSYSAPARSSSPSISTPSRSSSSGSSSSGSSRGSSSSSRGGGRR